MRLELVGREVNTSAIRRGTCRRGQESTAGGVVGVRCPRLGRPGNPLDDRLPTVGGLTDADASSPLPRILLLLGQPDL